MKSMPMQANTSSELTAATGMISFATPLGYMALARRDGAVVGLTIGHATPVKAIRSLVDLGLEIEGDLDEGDLLVQELQAFAAGEAVSFDEVDLDLEHLTTFQKSVVRHCRKIGYGETLSYKQLATKAGSPGAARAVGNTMAKNRFPILIPCHRVVGSAGALGGFSAPTGISLKERMLNMEAAALAGVS